MFKKILVTIDHSERNKYVFDSALSLAKATGATLMLLHILSEEQAGYPQLPSYAYYPILDNRDYEAYQEELANHRKWGLDLLQSLTEKATEAGVPTEYSQLTGNPGRMICELALNWSADLILIGSRGLKGLKEMFLGSVSNYVTHHAPCSVLIVRTVMDTKSDSTLSQEDDKTDSEQELTTN